MVFISQVYDEDKWRTNDDKYLTKPINNLKLWDFWEKDNFTFGNDNIFDIIFSVVIFAQVIY